jgi:6-phospho-beta-glucosidase
VNGKDRTDEVVGKLAAECPEPDASIVRMLRMLPSAYLRYYYQRDTVLEELRSAGKTRGETVLDIERDLLAMYQDTSLDCSPELLQKRGGAFYSEAALSLISDLYSDRAKRFVRR